MNKPALLLIAILVFASPAMAEINGHALLDNCMEAEKYLQDKNAHSIDFSAVNFCLGYISGIDELHKTFVSSVSCFEPPLFCIPPPADLEQFVKVVVRFLKEHPADLHFQGSVLTISALKQAFPCP